ncbi:hypothetical protein BBO_04505 [Beauveria brongniartii RCEF 3172]|uniref:Uncharacterized protein n=1 Tax=Beauveria brongniartii RCEF 3172 TaxID=1081107 RepID=A0A167E5X1_9HYPO|nr:hypothetical protein BBO_04505 [Beauveria brongniartii RCEF 3172]
MVTATSTSSCVAAPPLTTLFTQPNECTSLFTSLNTTNTFYESGQLETWSYYQSNTADARFSSCNPPGWDINNFTFSPAVCPSGWIYYFVTLTPAGRDERTYTQEHCCASGFTYEKYGQPNLPLKRCESKPTRLALSPGNDALVTADVTTVVTMHRPFVAQWHESETKTLPFSLPSMASGGASLHTWTPGSKAEPIGGGGKSETDANRGLFTTITALIIVGSILGFFLMIWLLWCAKNAMGE